MAINDFLVLEMRAAFRSCTHQHRLYSRRFISSTTSRLKSSSSKSSSSSNPARSWPYNGAVTPTKPPTPSARPKPTSQSTELSPRQEEQTAVDTDRRVPVPLRVIPKPDIGKNVRMTPRERLHIEVLTRQQPRKVEEKKVYRERLQIYHMGSLKENVLAILKVSCLTCACFVTFVIAPAHLKADTDLWLVALIWLGGFVPGIMVNYATKPMVTRIFLNLPVKARDTSKAAMEYAKNLPRDADLDIRYLKPYGLEGQLQARVSELEPASGNILRPVSFQFKNQKDSSFFRPSSFFVWPKSAVGEKSTNTIPGLWDNMYRKLMSTPENTVMGKWKKP